MKTVYDLKDAARKWYENLAEILVNTGRKKRAQFTVQHLSLSFWYYGESM